VPARAGGVGRDGCAGRPVQSPRHRRCVHGQGDGGMTSKRADGGECCDVGTIKGPPGTPYEGGVFQLEITIPSKCATMFVKRRGDRRRR
jgi:hypothetical protein